MSLLAIERVYRLPHLLREHNTHRGADALGVIVETARSASKGRAVSRGRPQGCHLQRFARNVLNRAVVVTIARGIDVVVSGHSHVPKIDTIDGVLYLNPGSAGRRRFRLSVTLATIDVSPDGLRPVIHNLGDA